MKPQIGVLFFLCFCVEKRNYVNEHLNSGHEFYSKLNCQKLGGMKRETKTIIKIAFSGNFSLVKKVTIFVLGIVSKNIFPWNFYKIKILLESKDETKKINILIPSCLPFLDEGGGTVKLLHCNKVKRTAAFKWKKNMPLICHFMVDVRFFFSHSLSLHCIVFHYVPSISITSTVNSNIYLPYLYLPHLLLLYFTPLAFLLHSYIEKVNTHATHFI